MRVFLILFILVGSSCTMQKRVHLKGWHVQWNKKYMTQKQLKDETRSTQISSEKTSLSSCQVESVNDLAEIEVLRIELNQNSIVHEDFRMRPQLNNRLETKIKVNSAPKEKGNKNSKIMKTKPDPDVIWMIVFVFSIGVLALAVSVFLAIIAANSITVSFTILAIFGSVCFFVIGAWFLLIGVGTIWWWS